MNYAEINKAILEGRDIDSALIKKDEKFYEYLFNNKVAFYYSKVLSKNTTQKEEWIIRRGTELNKKYFDTLKTLNDICLSNGIDFLLYKTHKHIPEVVDGDIDIFVKNEQFNTFMDVFRKNGFACIEDEPGKGKCEKDGCLVIEPHINISWRGGNYINENIIWENTKSIKVEDNFIVKSASNEVELVSLLGKVFFEPAYLDLYSIKQALKLVAVVDNNLISKNIQFSQPFNELLDTIKKEEIYTPSKLPLFCNNNLYFKTWSKQTLKTGDFKLFLLHSLYFIYWKYRYLFLSKLPFIHNWHEDQG